MQIAKDEHELNFNNDCWIAYPLIMFVPTTIWVVCLLSVLGGGFFG